MTDRELIQFAIRARDRAYAPYSDFRVGAALLGKSGTVYTGCNVENASFSATLCAERAALSKAVCEGEREFAAIAIVGGKCNALSPICPPCGVCRQVLAEFCAPDFRVIIGTPDHTRSISLSELLPLSFDATALN